MSTLEATVSRALPVSHYQRMLLAQRGVLLCLVILLSLAAGLVIGVNPRKTGAVFLAILGLLGGLLLLRRASTGIYILLIGAATFESFGLYFPDSLTDRVPFFQPLENFGILVPLSPAEILMVVTLIIVVLKRIAAREKPLELGPVFPGVLFYTVMVVYGFAYGLSTGGDLKDAVWEARVGFYTIFTYLLTFNLIRDVSQMRRMMWFFIGAEALKGMIGIFRYFVVLQGDASRVTMLSRSNAMLSHEESILFALFFVFLLLLMIFKADRKQLRLGLLVAPPVMVSFLANQRRAGILALLLDLFVLALIVYMLLPAMRRPMVRLGVVLVLAMVPYVALFGQSQGMLAQPARAIASLYKPTERDLGSDMYRVLEGENLKANIRQSPVLGAGYGKPMEQFVSLPDLTSIFSMWAFVPHNTVLWVWMRLGLLGFVAWWFLMGRSILQGIMAARSATDPYARVVAVLAVAVVVSWVAEGVVDMGLTDFRLTIMVGIFIGLVSRLEVIAKQKQPEMMRRAASPSVSA